MSPLVLQEWPLGDFFFLEVAFRRVLLKETGPNPGGKRPPEKGLKEMEAANAAHATESVLGLSQRFLDCLCFHVAAHDALEPYQVLEGASGYTSLAKSR